MSLMIIFEYKNSNEMSGSMPMNENFYCPISVITIDR